MSQQPVFDFHVGGPPVVLTDEIEAAIEAAVESGGPGGQGWDALQAASVRALRNDSDYRERLREAYDACGVTLPTTTLWSADRSRSYSAGIHRDLARWCSRFDELPWLRKVTGPRAGRRIVQDGDIGVVLNVQNLGAYTDGDVDRVDDLYNAGVRITQLTYNTQNAVGTGCTDRSDGGLSHHGVAVVERLNELGGVIDISHCGRETTLDAIAVSDDPVCVTHASCAAVHEHDRAKSDAEIEALADADGYMGILALPGFIVPEDETPSVDHLVDHVEHAASILGVDRVGIGTDAGMGADAPPITRPGLAEFFNAMGFRPEHRMTLDNWGDGLGDFRRYEDWQVIPDRLEARGFTETEVAGIIGENFLSYWDRVVN